MKSPNTPYKLGYEVIFYMNYKDYQNARDAAWKILIDCGVKELPVKITDICHSLQVSVFSYIKGRNMIKSLGLEEHASRTDGFTVYPKEATIFYNQNMTLKRCRFTIGHELGHLILGHIKCGQATAINREPSPDDDPNEKAANIFASRLLAPACVLWGLNLRQANDISKSCNISYQAAQFRAKRMELLYRREQAFLQEKGRSCFLQSPYERQVYEQFQKYIDQRSG